MKLPQQPRTLNAEQQGRQKDQSRSRNVAMIVLLAAAILILRFFPQKVSFEQASARVTWGERTAPFGTVQTCGGDIPMVFVASVEEMEALKRACSGYAGESVFAKYDADFFAKNRLVVLYVSAGSGSTRFAIDSMSLHADRMTVTVSATSPEIGTADMAAWLLFGEVSKTRVVRVSSYVSAWKAQ